MNQKVLIFLSLLVTLTACNLRKSAVGHENYINENIEEKEILIKAAQDSVNIPQFLYIKSNVEAEVDKDKFSFKLTIRLVKDSLIWMSISKGIPVAKVLITPDSIKIRNDLHNQYLMEEFDYIQNFINYELSFNTIQSIILGTPFYYYGDSLYKYVEDKPYHLLTTVKKRKLKALHNDLEEDSDLDEDDEDGKILIQGLWFNGFTAHVEEMFIREPLEKRKLWMKYNAFTRLEGHGLFPSNIYLKMKEKSEKKSIFTVEHTKIEVRDELSTPFKVPDSYERIF